MWRCVSTRSTTNCSRVMPTSPGRRRGRWRRLTQQGDRALEADEARAITENVVNLDARDVAGVCTMAIELFKQLEDDAARSLAPPPFQTRPPPPSLGAPSTKLLAAAQRDDANAIKACLAEGLILSTEFIRSNCFTHRGDVGQR